MPSKWTMSSICFHIRGKRCWLGRFLNSDLTPLTLSTTYPGPSSSTASSAVWIRQIVVRRRNSSSKEPFISFVSGSANCFHVGVGVHRSCSAPFSTSCFTSKMSSAACFSEAITTGLEDMIVQSFCVRHKASNGA